MRGPWAYMSGEWGEVLGESGEVFKYPIAEQQITEKGQHNTSLISSVQSCSLIHQKFDPPDLSGPLPVVKGRFL